MGIPTQEGNVPSQTYKYVHTPLGMIIFIILCVEFIEDWARACTILLVIPWIEPALSWSLGYLAWDPLEFGLAYWLSQECSLFHLQIGLHHLRTWEHVISVNIIFAALATSFYILLMETKSDLHQSIWLPNLPKMNSYLYVSHSALFVQFSMTIGVYANSMLVQLRRTISFFFFIKM